MEFYNHIRSKTNGVKGIITLYHDALRYRYMITEKALKKAKVLVFREKHGHKMALEAFEIKSRTLYHWQSQFEKGGKKPEALNDKSRVPKTKRKRLWPVEIIQEIKRLREDHPNLGKEKLHPELMKFCTKAGLRCPKPKTIGRLIHDLGGLRKFPQTVSHFGKIKKVNRQKVLRKPKDFKALYPGHCVALDTIEKHIRGRRRYVITFEDIYTRFSFAWSTSSHAALAAKEFFELCVKVFPYSFAMIYVLTDNGSEFKKHFTEELLRLHLTHYHTYPKTPKMNAHVERFNRTIQEEFIDYHMHLLLDTDQCNNKLIDWLIWYNRDRVHFAFQNKQSPLQYMLSIPQSVLSLIPVECKIGWPHTMYC